MTMDERQRQQVQRSKEWLVELLQSMEEHQEAPVPIEQQSVSAQP
jgi:hypothetical protein